ncbi:hypothetical protein [Bowdeniella nasicola]|nr:hypothetical protein [Bowdeniella nasicola]
MTALLSSTTTPLHHYEGLNSLSAVLRAESRMVNAKIRVIE